MAAQGSGEGEGLTSHSGGELLARSLFYASGVVVVGCLLRRRGGSAGRSAEKKNKRGILFAFLIEANNK